MDSVKYRCISSHYIAMHYMISRCLTSNCMLMHHIDSSHTHHITYHMTSHCVTASHRSISYALHHITSHIKWHHTALLHHIDSSHTHLHHISDDIKLHYCITSIHIVCITSHIAWHHTALLHHIDPYRTHYITLHHISNDISLDEEHELTQQTVDHHVHTIDRLQRRIFLWIDCWFWIYPIAWNSFSYTMLNKVFKNE